MEEGNRMKRVFGTLALFYVFCKLAGAFDPYIPQKRKSRRRECSPIHGKRKSSI